MRFASPFSLPRSSAPGVPPRDDELDLYGLTHVGRVRAENQDHFLLATIHPTVVVHATSLHEDDGLATRGQRLATLLLVADGVGGSAAGSLASRLATEAVTRYVASVIRCYHADESLGERQFLEEMRAAAIEAHNTVRAKAVESPDARDMATTLSLGIVIWPWLYILQVGDSRVYVCREGELQRLTRDQTLAQELVDKGVLPAASAERSPLSNVLSSAIGAEEAKPEISRVDVRERGTVILVCSDGLTKHVSDEEIGTHLARMESSQQVCRALLQLALDRGGTDNVTIVVGRALKQR